MSQSEKITVDLLDLMQLVNCGGEEAKGRLQAALIRRQADKERDAKFAEQYPHLTKEHEVRERAQEVFQFLEWLAENGINLARYSELGESLEWATTKTGKTGFIDEFYELDRQATEKEREALLASVQGMVPAVAVQL